MNQPARSPGSLNVVIGLFVFFGLLDLAGGIALFKLSKVPSTGWWPLISSLVFFGGAAWFWRVKRRG